MPEEEYPSPILPEEHTSKTKPKRPAKKQGELAEMAFMYKAASFGFGVAKPYGDSFQYDFLLDSGQRTWRVQVKSTNSRGRWGSYVIRACRSPIYGKARGYTAEEIDFLIAWIEPVDVWYVIPVQAFVPRIQLAVHPQDPASRGKYERFREAWCLMACQRTGKMFEDLEVEQRCQPSGRSERVVSAIGGCPLKAGVVSS